MVDSFGPLGDQLSFTSTGATPVTYCDIQDGPGNVAGLDQPTQWGAGNIQGNPQFVNPSTTATADFHVTKFSPCLNRGDPLYVPFAGETDIDGGARILQSRTDIGADERGSGTLIGP